MNTFKLLGGLASALAVFALVVTPADAAVTQSNTDTGALSKNVNKLKVAVKNIFKKKNKATISNVVVATGNTGGNNQNKNTNGGSLTTGNVSATVTLSNTANQGDDCGCPTAEPPVVDLDQSNSNTGFNSDNVNKVTAKLVDKTTIKNVANLNNVVVADGNTGDNDQNKNTTVGDMTTGDVTATISVTNTAN